VADVAAVLGAERVVETGIVISALVINRDGTIAGFQDKVQLDPSEDRLYSSGFGRHVFHAGPVTFGIAICHEGWRYPETVRRAAQRGAAYRVPSASPRSRTGQFPAHHLRRSGEFLPRKSGDLPGSRKYLLLRHGQLRERWVSNHFRVISILGSE